MHYRYSKDSGVTSVRIMWVTSPRSNFVRVLEHKLVCMLGNLPELPVTYIIRVYLSYPQIKVTNTQFYITFS